MRQMGDIDAVESYNHVISLETNTPEIILKLRLQIREISSVWLGLLTEELKSRVNIEKIKFCRTT